MRLDPHRMRSAAIRWHRGLLRFARNDEAGLSRVQTQQGRMQAKAGISAHSGRSGRAPADAPALLCRIRITREGTAHSIVPFFRGMKRLHNELDQFIQIWSCRR
jgi:hypothetical protein